MAQNRNNNDRDNCPENVPLFSAKIFKILCQYFLQFAPPKEWEGWLAAQSIPHPPPEKNSHRETREISYCFNISTAFKS